MAGTDPGTRIWTAASPPSLAGRRTTSGGRHHPLRPAAAAITGVIPGANSWLAGRRGLASIVAGATLMVLALGLLVVQLSGGLLQTFVSPPTLALLGGLNLAVLGVRLTELRILRMGRGHHVLQRPAARPYRRRDRHHARRSQTVAVILAATVITLPHAAMTWQLETVRRTLNETFAVASATSDPSVPTRAGGALVGTSTAPTGPATPPPSPVEPAMASAPVGELPSTDDATIDILLIGLDSGAGRTGARNDANMVLSIDPNTAEVALIGIPRNLVHIPLPSSEDDCRCYRPPLYSLYGHGQANPDVYAGASDPGAEAVRQAASALLDRTIEWYFVADLAAFRHLVDAVGGIEVEVSESVQGSWPDPEDLHERIGVDIDPGRHRLDGSAALAYARTRADSDDYRRMARQRCLVASASGTARSISPAQAAGLLASTRGELASDIPLDTLPALVELGQRVETDRIDSLGLVPPDFITGRVDGYPVPDLTRIREAVRELPGADSASKDASSEC